MNVNGLTDEDKFVQLQEKTKGEAKGLVENFIYLDDKAAALSKAWPNSSSITGKEWEVPKQI